MKLLQVTTLGEAREKLAQSLQNIPRATEKLPLLQAKGRILAEDIHAPEDVPAFCRSAVDGYAVVSGDTFGASDSIPVFLDVAGEVLIGQEAAMTVAPGQCAYVPTGGMLPKGADAMVMVEYCEPFGPGSVAVYQPAASGNHVVCPGDDMKAGSLVLAAGSLLRFQEMGALAAMGIAMVEVYKPLSVTILSTGDELVPLSGKPKTGQVYDSNSHALRAQAEDAGMEVAETFLVPDDEESMGKIIETAMGHSDMVIVSGGSSQGRKDMTEKLFDKITHGGVYIHGLALKPGKPTILAWDESTHTVLAGLPGHPVAASIVFELLISWAVSGKAAKCPALKGEISVNIASAPGRETCLPVKLTQAEGRYLAKPVLGRSGLWTTLTQADGYILIDRNREGLKAGETVEVCLFLK